MCTDKMQEMDLKLKEGRSTLAHPDVGVERETQRNRERERLGFKERFLLLARRQYRDLKHGEKSKAGEMKC